MSMKTEVIGEIFILTSLFSRFSPGDSISAPRFAAIASRFHELADNHDNRD
jgi:hypothetical protein